MPRNSTGTFARVNNSFSDPVADTIISDTDATALWSDYDDALTDSLSRTGKGGMETDLDMGSHKINNVTDPTAAQDAATKAYADAILVSANAHSDANLVTAEAYTDAAVSGSLHGAPVSKTAAYAIVNADKGKTFYFGGSAYYTVTVGAASGFDADFRAQIINSDSGRGKLISINGVTSFILWPGQSITIVNTGSAWTVAPPTQRWKPTSGQTFYVLTTGSDSNDGLANNAGGALLTITQAIANLKNYYDNGNGVATIQLGNGTFNVGAGVNLNYYAGGSANQTLITGDTTTPANVIITCSAGGSCFIGRDGQGTYTITGVRYQTAGNGSTALNVSQFFQLDWGLCEFGAFQVGSPIFLSDMGSADIVGPYKCDGNFASFLVCNGHSKANYGTHDGNIAAALTFTQWLAVSDGGFINAGGVAPTFSGVGAGAGSAGKQYTNGSQGIIESAGATYPGNAAGTTDAATYALFA